VPCLREGGTYRAADGGQEREGIIQRAQGVHLAQELRRRQARDDATRPDEQRMVKRFRRSAAGYDEQLPSDIRTPATLKMTLDYLLDNIIGGEERLASVHKFVWDRTRGIRNDFSIQQVTKKEEVKIAVECLERIARFHILSLHQLSNPEHLVGEQFDAHQDREQLNNTLLSLMYYYDDNRHVLDFSNEAEFRAYCIIFELQSQHPDLEDRMQSWPKALLEDGRIKTAFKLYAAAGNNLFDQGPLRPMKPFSLAQGNTGSFWSILASKQVSYLMACVAEIYFSQVRFMALRALWVAATSAPASQRAKNQDWTLKELANVLGFDAEEQAAEFCEEFGLKISTKVDGTQYLDASINKALDSECFLVLGYTQSDLLTCDRIFHSQQTTLLTRHC
jgi:nuclear mRNA export protein SAC3